MDQHSLDGIFAKLDRADEHLVALADETRAFVESEPNRYVVEVDYDAGRYVVRVDIRRQPPLRLSILCGDFIQCLRHALDHLAWAIVPAPGRRTAFPIYGSADQFDREVRNPKKPTRGRLYGLDPNGKVLAYVERVQPYSGAQGVRNHPLWLLEQLSFQDKHRAILARVSSHGRSADLRIGGDDLEFAGKAVYRYDQPLEDGAEVIAGAFKPVRPVPEPKPVVKVFGHLPLDVAFGDEGVPSESLADLRNAAREIVEGVKHYNRL